MPEDVRHQHQLPRLPRGLPAAPGLAHLGGVLTSAAGGRQLVESRPQVPRNNASDIAQGSSCVWKGMSVEQQLCKSCPPIHGRNLTFGGPGLVDVLDWTVAGCLDWGSRSCQNAIGPQGTLVFLFVSQKPGTLTICPCFAGS